MRFSRDEATVELDIPVLLSGVEDEHDQCVARLRERVAVAPGVRRAHVERRDGAAVLCVHYDAGEATLAQVERLARLAGAELGDRFGHELLWVRGMDCGDCATSVEHIVRRSPGVVSASVSYAAERMRVEYDRELTDHGRIVRQVRAMGYEVEERRPQGWWRRNRHLLLALSSGLFLVIGFAGRKLFGLPEPAAVGLYAAAYLAGGFEAARHGVAAAVRLRFDIDFLMVVAALGAAAVGAWAEGALLLFLFSLGHALEHAAMDRARDAIGALGKVTPKSARVRRDGLEQTLAVVEVERGDLVIVRPGERLPVDGTIVAGVSAVDQSPITGESVPVEKRPGEPVFAGSVNGEAALEIEVTKLARDTTLARMVTLVEEAQTQKSPTQRFTERFARVFVPAVLVAVVAMMLAPPLAGWLGWREAFLRAMAILVAASPCALAISTPAAVLSAIGRAARAGVLIKGGVHLENLGVLRAIAFDKTGTITEGKPEVTDLIAFDGVSEEELVSIAAAVESRSNHPLARAIVRRAESSRLALPAVRELEQIPGRGVEAELAGEHVRVGSLKLFESTPVPEPARRAVAQLEAAGRTTMLVAADGRFLGVVGLADRPRQDASDAMRRLRLLGVGTLAMLTGDNARVAEAVGNQVGLSEQYADLLPEQKVDAVEALIAEHGTVAMVGDGVNDAPALARATIGIAMGAGGTDVALETADIALMADDLGKLPFAVGLGRQARRVIRGNLLVSLGVVLLLVPAAALGLAGIGAAIVVHEGSTLIVVANGLRLLGYHGDHPATEPRQKP